MENKTTRVRLISVNEADKFQVLKDMELSKVPNVGDKIIVEGTKDGQLTAYVCKVVEVHFSDKGKTEVWVIRIDGLAAYLQTLHSMTHEK